MLRCTIPVCMTLIVLYYLCFANILIINCSRTSPRKISLSGQKSTWWCIVVVSQQSTKHFIISIIALCKPCAKLQSGSGSCVVEFESKATEKHELPYFPPHSSPSCWGPSLPEDDSTLGQEHSSYGCPLFHWWSKSRSDN